MKKIKNTRKTNFFKKIFIKFCRFLGYEIIDQSNFRSSTLNKDLNEYNEDLVDLDEEIEKTRERYKEQYGAMEATVNSFKRTGEYLTNYMEAQNSD